MIVRNALLEIQNSKSNKKELILILMGVFLILIISGCASESAGKMQKKVLLIGIDGMDPKVMSKLMDDGKLPNFTKLRETGTYTELQTSISPQSPIAWTSIATGCNPGKHNIFDFIRRNPENYLPELSLAKSKAGIASTNYEPYVKGKQFWKITSEAGIPSTVIRWPLTFPAEKTEGSLLSGLGVPDIKGLLNSYSFYTSGDYPKDEEGSEKVIEVDVEDNEIETLIKGPRTSKGGEIVDITTPMKILVSDDSAKLIIQDKEYDVKLNGWSDWVKINFKINFLSKASGICRFYLVSTKPFSMYMTTVQIDPEKPVQQISYPKEYSKELVNTIGLFNTLGLPEDTNALNEKKIDDKAFLEQVEQIDEERNKMFWYEFSRFKEGVFAFVFDGSDRIQHMFWDEKVLDKKSKEFEINPAIEKYYIKKDKFLGQVLDRIDEETTLFLLSDHGFTSFERAVTINSWLVENGYMVLIQNPTEKDSGELFKYVDWSKTKAYSVGFTSIFINLKGREGKGIVEPGEKDKLIDEIAEKLEKLEDNGKKAMLNVYKSSEAYSGDYVKDGPDLIVGFAPGYRMGWQNAIGGVTPEIFFDNTKHWNGDHLVDPSVVPGVLFANIKIAKEKPNQMDIAPTVLEIFGINIPEEMDGKSLLK